MTQRRKAGRTRELTDQEMRDQEVLRANRELAAYFKGRRTEREARAAVKIIKAFLRDREHKPVNQRPPIPGVRPARVEKPKTTRKPRKRKTIEDKSSAAVPATPVIDVDHS